LIKLAGLLRELRLLRSGAGANEDKQEGQPQLFQFHKSPGCYSLQEKENHEETKSTKKGKKVFVFFVSSWFSFSCKLYKNARADSERTKLDGATAWSAPSLLWLPRALRIRCGLRRGSGVPAKALGRALGRVPQFAGPLAATLAKAENHGKYYCPTAIYSPIR
jgi:hypothetical protein